MATISKFYMHDALSPLRGTLPSGAFKTNDVVAPLDGYADSTSQSLRDATDSIGTSNPHKTVSVNTAANTNLQQWGMRRFVSRPLGAQSISLGTWTFDHARSESNLNTNLVLRVSIFLWSMHLGIYLNGGFLFAQFSDGVEPSSTSIEVETKTEDFGAGVSIDCDEGAVLIFEYYISVAQSSASSFVGTLAYDGTIEGSTTTNATFIQPSTPIILADPTLYNFNLDKFPKHPLLSAR